MNKSLYLHHMLICSLLFMTRGRERANSVSERWLSTEADKPDSQSGITSWKCGLRGRPQRFRVRFRSGPKLSDDSSERLWLVIAYISSTELCVIGYNAQHWKTSKKKYDGTNKSIIDNNTSLKVIIIILISSKVLATGSISDYHRYTIILSIGTTLHVTIHFKK